MKKYDDAIIDSPIKPTERHSGFNYIIKNKKQSDEPLSTTDHHVGFIAIDVDDNNSPETFRLLQGS